MTDTNPTPPTKNNPLSNLVNTIAFDIAGLGFIGAAIYSGIFTKDTTATTTFVGLGAAYLGVKVPS